MQHELNHIVQTLLGSQNLDEVSRENLASLTREFPYSPILHLLYSKKLQVMQDPHFAESVAQTALYFSNPHWLNSLLRPKSSRDAMEEMEQAYAQTYHARTEAEPTTVNQDVSRFIQEPAIEEAEAIAQEQVSEEQTTELPAEGVAEIAAPEPVMEEVQATPQEEYVDEKVTEQLVEKKVEMPALESFMEEIHANDKFKHWAEPDIRVLDQPIEDIPQEWPAKVENERTEAYHEQPLEQKEPEQTAPAPTPEEKKAVHEAPLEGLIPIEPLYTIDYFASQGIQLTDEEKLDPLGRKLKSFTEWLKTMKKVHPVKTKMSMDDKTEGSIKEGAEHSNDRAEVVTEAMAEVYLKQGLKHKAIEVYQKLSLLNPSHSANFAAKIAELKATEL